MGRTSVERQARYRARKKEKDDGTVAGLALLEVELAEARAQQAEELRRAGDLQAQLFTHHDTFRAGGLRYEPTASTLALARGGPGWDDHHLQVASNMTAAQFLKSWSNFSLRVTEALGVGASDEALARLVTERGAFNSSLAKLRFDFLMAGFEARAADVEAAEALALSAARTVVATMTWEQQAGIAPLRERLQAAVAARGQELRRATAEADVEALEVWGQVTLAELWVFHEAAREALTPRQRAVVAALHRNFLPDSVRVMHHVYALVTDKSVSTLVYDHEAPLSGNSCAAP